VQQQQQQQQQQSEHIIKDKLPFNFNRRIRLISSSQTSVWARTIPNFAYFFLSLPLSSTGVLFFFHGIANSAIVV
jgi:hypothetical protein